MPSRSSDTFLEQALDYPEESRGRLALADVMGETKRSQQGVPRRPYSVRQLSSSVRRCVVQRNPPPPSSKRQGVRGVEWEGGGSDTHAAPIPLR